MKVPGVHPGRAIAQVRAIDIMPTVLALPGVTPSSALDGVSLRPILEDRKSDPGLQAYVESQYARLHFGWAPLAASAPSATSSSMHRSPSCTNLKDDPTETKNLAAGSPDVTGRLATSGSGSATTVGRKPFSRAAWLGPSTIWS